MHNYYNLFPFLNFSIVNKKVEKKKFIQSLLINNRLIIFHANFKNIDKKEKQLFLI